MEKKIKILEDGLTTFVKKMMSQIRKMKLMMYNYLQEIKIKMKTIKMMMKRMMEKMKIMKIMKRMTI